MKQKNLKKDKLNLITQFLEELKDENEHNSNLINSGKLDTYVHSVKVHTYNNTLKIIKRLEKIINE